jgi:hypothetical protein
MRAPHRKSRISRRERIARAAIGMPRPPPRTGHPQARPGRVEASRRLDR